MHRTQLCLEPQQYQHLRQVARSRKTSLGRIVRELIDEAMAQKATKPDPFLKAIGSIRLPKDNLSERVKDYLYGPERDPHS